MKKRSVGTVMLLLMLSFPGSLFAQSILTDYYSLLSSSGFTENFETRNSLRETLLSPVLKATRAPSTRYEQVTSPDVMVAFDVRKTATDFYYIFRNEHNGKFPTDRRGNYIIKRDLATGDYIQLKIFLRDGNRSIARITPDRGNCRMDISLMDKTLYRSVTIPLSFEEVIVSPFARIMALTENFVRWDLLFTDSSYGEWQDVENIVKISRTSLYKMDETEDGGLNSRGEWVFIENEMPQGKTGVNCSGFAQWIANGIYAGDNRTPQGPYLSLKDLKKKHLDLRGKENSWSLAKEELDPYFGLDWVRNIASLLYSNRTDTPWENVTGTDVSSQSFIEFNKEVGYPMEDIEPLIYLLAVENPGYIYFGAVNTPNRDDTGLRLFHHIAVILPYFTPDGDFHPVILDTGMEKTVQGLKKQYPDSYIFLTRARAGMNFYPPKVTE